MKSKESERNKKKEVLHRNERMRLFLAFVALRFIYKKNYSTLLAEFLQWLTLDNDLNVLMICIVICSSSSSSSRHNRTCCPVTLNAWK